MQKISDSDVVLLASIAGTFKEDYARKDKELKWRGSPFNWIRVLPPSQKGKIGVQLIAGWCAARDLNVNRRESSAMDKIIEGHSIEVKFSMLWENGTYTFQQIRDQDYAYLICLGISPFDAHCWVIPKYLAMQHATPQHMGKAGKDTLWFSVDPNNSPDWLHGHGGKLCDAKKIFDSW